jgi:FtsH-binding integral membrane protein
MSQIVTRSDAQVSESNFISKVYMWMALGLAVSGAGSAWILSQPQLLKALYTNSLMLIGLVIAEVALVVILSAAIGRLSSGTASLLFIGYSFLNGLTLASVFLVYTGESILQTLAVTAGTFLFFSFYGATTKKDLTSIGSLAMMGLVGMILASLVNIFLKSSALMWVTTYLGIAVFLGLIAYDTQKLKALYAHGLTDDESRKKLAVVGALALYLDFINLFILLLRIFGKRRD